MPTIYVKVKIPMLSRLYKNELMISGYKCDNLFDNKDTFQSAEPLPELSATKRARSRMTHIAKSMKLKAKQSPTNSNQDLCSRLLLLQRSFKVTITPRQILHLLFKP